MRVAFAIRFWQRSANRCGSRPARDIDMSLVVSGGGFAEWTLGQLVRMFTELGLVRRLAATQGEHANFGFLKMNFGSDESMCPMGVNQKGVAQHLDLATVIGAAYEDHATLGMFLQVEVPGGGKRPARRSAVHALAVAQVGGADVVAGPFSQGSQGGGQETQPDFFLPKAVEGFDGGLEAGFARRRKHGDDVQGQAQADDASERVGKVMGPLEGLFMMPPK